LAELIALDLAVELEEGLRIRRRIGLQIGRVSVQAGHLLIASLLVVPGPLTGVLLALPGALGPRLGVFLNALRHGTRV